jgi:hypothetical protein
LCPAGRMISAEGSTCVAGSASVKCSARRRLAAGRKSSLRQGVGTAQAGVVAGARARAPARIAGRLSGQTNGEGADQLGLLRFGVLDAH